MIRNYLKIAWRNQLKRKNTLFINMVGLSSGLAAFILIFLWIQDELSMDKFHASDKQLFQIMEVNKANGQVRVLEGTQGLLAESMANDFPEVEKATAFFSLVKENFFFNLKGKTNEILKSGGVFADKDFFDMFSYHLLEGQANDVLNNKDGAVISKKLAEALFGKSDNYIGKSFDWEVTGLKGLATVTGVLDNIPNSSTQKFDFVLTKAKLFELVPNFKEWHNEGTNTFLQLKTDTDIGLFNDKIKNYLKKYGQGERFTLFVRPYSSAYLYGEYENGVQKGGRIAYVKLFSIIGLFILLIACINFMNLSTASAAKREKEIGVKKAIGSSRQDLIYQFMIESFLICVASMTLAMIIVRLLLPQFNTVTNKEISLNIEPQNLIYLLLITLTTSLLSGSYPSFYLSGLSTISILKGRFKTSSSELFARKGLVVFQFVVSFFLIVGVMVIYQQVKYIQTMNLGYDKENVVYIEREGRLIQNYEAFLNRIRSLPSVKNAASINGAIAQAGDNSTTSGLQWEGKNPNLEVNFSVKTVDYDLIETLDIKMAEGRAFSKSFGDEAQNLILNETAIKIMGLKNPIGKTINMGGENKTIIGVTKDFFANSVHEAISPIVMRFDPSKTSSFVIKIKKGMESQALSAIKPIYGEFNEGHVFRYTFMDEKYQQLYAAEQGITLLSRFFAVIAILISCLGLFGLAVFNAENRVKEIGIRKVLGASISSLVFTLSKDFLQLIFWAILIAIPLSWWAMNQWLQSYAYKIDMSKSTFIIAAIGLIAITLLTVSYQAIKAALMNPVKSLKTE